MDRTTLTLTPDEKTVILRAIAEIGITLATDREMRYLLFPRDENQLTFWGLNHIGHTYSFSDKTLPGRLGELANNGTSIATHAETYPEMYNANGDRIGYPFESRYNYKRTA
jgi:hypothetical protein